MSEASLSVLMPNYNHAHYLPHALDAILAQSYRPLEVVVVDDGSTDDSLAVLERYRERAPDTIRVLTNPRNIGITPSVARLIRMAAGDYIYFAAADDLILPGFFEKSMRYLNERPDAALCTALGRTIDLDGRDTGHVSVSPFPPHTRGFVSAAECRLHVKQRDFCILGLATIYHRRRLVDAGAFRPELGPLTDAFIAQALALRHGVCFVNEVLVAGRWTGTNYSTLMADPDKGLEVHDNVLHLMQNGFSDAFPPDYVELWQRRSCFNNARYLLRGSEVNFKERMSRLATRASGVDALAMTVVARGISVFTTASLMLLGAVIKRRDIPRWLWSQVRRRLGSSRG